MHNTLGEEKLHEYWASSGASDHWIAYDLGGDCCVTTFNITEKTYFAPAAQPAQPVQVMRAAAANAAANAWGPFGTQS